MSAGHSAVLFRTEKVQCDVQRGVTFYVPVRNNRLSVFSARRGSWASCKPPGWRCNSFGPTAGVS